MAFSSASYSPSIWRTEARAVIAKVRADNPGVTGPALKKLANAAYPFGPRQYHPYKIWLSELRAQFPKPRPVCKRCGGAGWYDLGGGRGSATCGCLASRAGVARG